MSGSSYITQLLHVNQQTIEPNKENNLMNKKAPPEKPREPNGNIVREM